MTLVITRAEAKAQGLKRYFTGKPCKRGHVAERFVASGACLLCNQTAMRTWFGTNKEKMTAWNKKWYSEHKEKNRERQLEWVRANRSKDRAYGAKRRAAELMATPPWADFDLILSVYQEAERLSSETGIAHDVDHIVPLQHPEVCGLHVHYNLRAVPASVNRTKGNRLSNINC